MTGWKKLVLLSFSAAFGGVTALLLAAFGTYRYQHPTRPRKDWPEINLGAVGVKADLYTEVRSGSVRYGFLAEPLDLDYRKDFDRVASSDPSPKSFKAILRDTGGFELCSQEVGSLTNLQDDSGKITGLMSEGMLSCSASDYLEAAKWDLTYQFPKLHPENSEPVKAELRRLLNDPEFLSSSPAKQREAFLKLTGDQTFSKFTDAEVAEFVQKMREPAQLPKRRPQPLSLEMADRLALFDPVENKLVTDSGAEFSVPYEGGHILASRWAHSGNSEYHCPLRLSCDANGDCTIENRWNDQKISAKLVKRPPSEE